MSWERVILLLLNVTFKLAKTDVAALYCSNRRPAPVPSRFGFSCRTVIVCSGTRMSRLFFFGGSGALAQHDAETQSGGGDAG